jgi:hypothetical protein
MTSKLILTLGAALLTGCTGLTQQESNSLDAMLPSLLAGNALPAATSLNDKSTLQLGSEGHWTGRIEIDQNSRPEDIVDSVAQAIEGTGWSMTQQIHPNEWQLVLRKDSQFATVRIPLAQAGALNGLAVND